MEEINNAPEQNTIKAFDIELLQYDEDNQYYDLYVDD